MKLSCPVCNARSISITHSIELPYDGSYDEIALQVVRCSQCNFFGIAAYKESRRGALDREVVIHEVYEVAHEDMVQVRNLIDACSHRNEPKCTCPSHRILSKRTGTRWDALSYLGVRIRKVFIL